MDERASQARRRRLPDRRLPWLYFGFGHLCLGAAFAAVAAEPAAFAGFYYHPRLLAAVHLVTLGWISGSILGALHLVGPMALRTPMPVGRADYWAFAGFVLGATGIVSHFWLEELSGVGLSGLLLAPVFARVGWKALARVRRAPIELHVKLHLALAFANLGGAVVAGTVFGFNRWRPFLPGATLDHAYAHAHLALLGWATMTVFAAGYRLLPMFLPAAMPAGRAPVAGAVMLEAGVLGIFVSLLAGGGALAPFAALTVAGIATFFFHLGWMLRHRRPAPRGRVLPDWGVFQILQALTYLAVACGLGLTLAFASTTDVGRIWLYGVCGLVGFLAQMVVGVSHRLLPLFAWLTATAAADWQRLPPSPHALPDRRLQAATAVAWTAGVPLLAAGFAGDRLLLLRLGASLLTAAVIAAALAHLAVWRAARRGRSGTADGTMGQNG